MRFVKTMFWRKVDGAAAVEFAIVLPLILTIILGSIQLYWIARAKMMTLSAARILADLVSQENNVSVASIGDFCYAVKLSIHPLSSDTLNASIASVSYTTSGRKVDWTDTTCGNVSSINNALTSAASVTQAAGDSAIVINVSYVYTTPISFPLGSTFTLSGSAVAQPRNGTSVTHS